MDERPDTAACIDLVATESARAHAALKGIDLATPVPSADGWTAADLAWHLAEVQWFWALIVGDLLQAPDSLRRTRRLEDANLLHHLAAQSAALEAALRRRDPSDVCYSWFEHGRSVGWVARRQAHEALIHRVDAELVAGLPVTPAAPEVADDGVQEITAVMLHVPSWGTFSPDGISARLDAVDTGSVWTLVLGRFAGIEPDTGEVVDEDAARLAADEGPAQVTALISGDAWDLDRWLWGRGPLDSLLVEGDAALPRRLRAITTMD